MHKENGHHDSKSLKDNKKKWTRNNKPRAFTLNTELDNPVNEQIISKYRKRKFNSV